MELYAEHVVYLHIEFVLPLVPVVLSLNPLNDIPCGDPQKPLLQHSRAQPALAMPPIDPSPTGPHIDPELPHPEPILLAHCPLTPALGPGLHIPQQPGAAVGVGVETGLHDVEDVVAAS